MTGLLGIGGGIITVPALLFVLPLLGIEPYSVYVATGLSAVVGLGWLIVVSVPRSAPSHSSCLDSDVGFWGLKWRFAGGADLNMVSAAGGLPVVFRIPDYQPDDESS